MHDFVLVLTIETIPKFDKGHDSSILFIGGFDPVRIVNNKSIDTSFLALAYPSLNSDNLIKMIGSIDYQPKPH